MQGVRKTYGLKFSKTLRKLGVTDLPHAKIFHPRDSFRYKGWRKKVLAKNGGMCFFCGSRKSTQAHHMAAFSLNPDKRYDVENGVGTCSKCHPKTHNFGSKVNRWRKAPPGEEE